MIEQTRAGTNQIASLIGLAITPATFRAEMAAAIVRKTAAPSCARRLAATNALECLETCLGGRHGAAHCGTTLNVGLPVNADFTSWRAVRCNRAMAVACSSVKSTVLGATFGTARTDFSDGATTIDGLARFGPSSQIRTGSRAAFARSAAGLADEVTTNSGGTEAIGTASASAAIRTVGTGVECFAAGWWHQAGSAVGRIATDPRAAIRGLAAAAVERAAG